jgi:hypothetical protein
VTARSLTTFCITWNENQKITETIRNPPVARAAKSPVVNGERRRLPLPFCGLSAPSGIAFTVSFSWRSLSRRASV